MPDRAANNIKKLGRYDIVRVLGKGAMGVVYEARDPNLNRKVAIKTVRVDSLSTEEAAEYELRFRTEAHSAARLQHPNIVSVYDSDRDGNTPFLVMEFVKGEDLKHYLDSGQRYSLEQSARMMRDLLAALDYAHQRKIIHRDIKPANLLIEADGRVKLTDFGVARIQDSGEATRTQGGMVGTLKYMSPEQVEGKSADASSDLFSAGIVLYQLLTDRRPFDGDSYFSIVNQIANQHPPAPSSINRMLPSALDAVVARALAKDKTQRFATAQDFSLALQAAARRADPTITPLANPYKIIEQMGTGSHERSGSTASTLTSTGSTVTQELELVYWKDVKDSDDPTDLEGFLVRFPDGVYADLAKRRLKRIAQTQASKGQDLYDRTMVATDTPRAPDDVMTDFTMGIADNSVARSLAAALQASAEPTMIAAKPAEPEPEPVHAPEPAAATEPVALAVNVPTPSAAPAPAAQPMPGAAGSPEPVEPAQAAPHSADLPLAKQLPTELPPTNLPPTNLLPPATQNVVAAPSSTADLAHQATNAAQSTHTASSSTQAPVPPARKKPTWLIGLATLVVGAVGLWAWQGQSSKVITESSSEAGLIASPARPASSTSSGTASLPDLTSTLVTSGSGTAPSLTVATPGMGLASSPLSAASEPASGVSATATSSDGGTKTTTIAAPKTASSAARALAAAKLQAQRDAAAAKAAAAVTTITQAAPSTTTIQSAPHSGSHANTPIAPAASTRTAPAPSAPSRARDSAATGPQEACEGKLLFGYGACLYEQCAKAVFQSHPYCVDQRERQEKARSRN